MKQTLQQRTAAHLDSRGVSASQFCKELGIPISSFHRWMSENRTIRSEHLIKILTKIEALK